MQKKFFFLTPCQVTVFFFISVVFLMFQNKDKNNNNFIYDALQSILKNDSFGYVSKIIMQ